jgi:hypothetical protein
MIYLFVLKKFIPPTGKTQKLCATLHHKRHYILHYRNLKQALQHGLKLTKIHRVLKFNQAPWLKSCIDLNTKMRNKSTNALERDVFKLMNNSVFGKTMESVDKRVNVKLVTSWHSNGRRPEAENFIARLNFKNCSIFNKNFVAIQMNKEYVLYDKSLYVGFTILDLSENYYLRLFLHFLETEIWRQS